MCVFFFFSSKNDDNIKPFEVPHGKSNDTCVHRGRCYLFASAAAWLEGGDTFVCPAFDEVHGRGVTVGVSGLSASGPATLAQVACGDFLFRDERLTCIGLPRAKTLPFGKACL